MIKHVTDSDHEILFELSKRAIEDSVIATPATKKEILQDTQAHIAQGMESAEHIFLKAIDGYEKTVGFIILKNGWNLSDLFVEPESQNMGFGRDLFKEALSILHSRENRGFIRVNSSINAEGFYRALGFQDYPTERPVPDFIVPLILTFAPNSPTA